MNAQQYRGIPQLTKYSTSEDTGSILFQAQQRGLDVDVCEYMAFGVSYDEAVAFAKITRDSQLSKVIMVHFTENLMTEKDKRILSTTLRRTIELFDMYLSGKLSCKEVLRLQSLASFNATASMEGVDMDLVVDAYYMDMLSMEEALKTFI